MKKATLKLPSQKRRNAAAASPLMRKGGVHQPKPSSQRAKAKRELRRAIDQALRPSKLAA